MVTMGILPYQGKNIPMVKNVKIIISVPTVHETLNENEQE
jgi:hypothetical protein